MEENVENNKSKKTEKIQFVKFTASSVVSAVCDLVLFTYLQWYWGIFFATIIARVVSATINFVINKLWCFKTQRKSFKEFLLFTILFLVKMFLSGIFVKLLQSIKLPLVLIKSGVDIVLFFLSYVVQKKIIFVS